MVAFTGVTTTNCGLPIHTKGTKSSYLTVLCSSEKEIKYEITLRKLMHLNCNYHLPPSVMGSLNGHRNCKLGSAPQNGIDSYAYALVAENGGLGVYFGTKQ